MRGERTFPPRRLEGIMTPVPAGHDQFPRSLVVQILGREDVALLDEAEAWEGDALNMTYLALRFSGYVNGVAMRHG